MSQQGKLIRGMKYYLQRDNKGEFPKGIDKDSQKMNDVNFYLSFIADKNEARVNKILCNIRHLSRNGMQGKEIYHNALSILKSDELLKEKPVEEGAK